MTAFIRRHGPVLAMWLIISAILIYTSWTQIVTRSGWDPDDQLRLVQLRDFLGGQSWFDTTQYRMNVPDGAPMHWSRLIELPLALVVILMTPVLGTATAEMVAGTLVPLITLGIIIFLLASTANRVGGQMVGYFAALLTVISPGILIPLRPMRIDHHGWQLACTALSLWALFLPDRKNGGFFLGLGLAVWLHISLEGAPLTAAFFILLGWRWIFRSAESVRLFWSVASFAAVSTVLFLGTQAKGLMAVSYCDTISPPHVFAILAAAAILLPVIWMRPAQWYYRFAAAALAGGAALAVLFMLAPQCAQGAFATLDPIVREYWYNNVAEGMPIWNQDRQAAATLLAPLLCGLLASGILLRTAKDEERSTMFAVMFLLLYATLLSVLVMRTITTATLFAIVPTAMLVVKMLQRYRLEPVLARRLLLVPGLIFLFVSGSIAGSAMAALMDKTETKIEKLSETKTEQCTSVGSIAKLAQLPKGNIAAGFNIGPAILMTTPHSVVASSHHRNEAAMRDLIDIFRLPPQDSYAILKRRRVDYIVLCPEDAELSHYLRKNSKGLWAQMTKSKFPMWLEPMPSMGKGIKVWRVR